jgi:hypothetical protein
VLSTLPALAVVLVGMLTVLTEALRLHHEPNRCSHHQEGKGYTQI